MCSLFGYLVCNFCAPVYSILSCWSFKMSVFIIYSICNHKLFYIWLLHKQTLTNTCFRSMNATMNMHLDSAKQFTQFIVQSCTLQMDFIPYSNWKCMLNDNSWSGLNPVDTMNERETNDIAMICNLEGVFQCFSPFFHSLLHLKCRFQCTLYFQMNTVDL